MASAGSEGRTWGLRSMQEGPVPKKFGCGERALQKSSYSFQDGEIRISSAVSRRQIQESSYPIRGAAWLDAVKTTRPGSPQAARIGGRPWATLGFVTVLLSVATGIGLGASLTAGLARNDLSSLLVAMFAGLVIWGFSIAYFFFLTVSEVRINDSGLSFKVRLKWQTAAWSEVLPPRYPLSFGSIPIEWGPDGVHHVNVGRRTALAIIDYPAHPRWTLPEDIVSSLGHGTTISRTRSHAGQ